MRFFAILSNSPRRTEQSGRTRKMKTHTELLNQLIDAVYALPFSTFKEAHDLQMLAAEIKGQMMVQLPPMMTLDTETGKVTPTPDADGWVENTGVMPECDISAIRWYCGEVINVANDKHWAWEMKLPEHWAWGLKLPSPEKFHITHYKPA